MPRYPFLLIVGSSLGFWKSAQTIVAFDDTSSNTTSQKKGSGRTGLKKNCTLTVAQPRKLTIASDGKATFVLDANTFFWVLPLLPALMCHLGRHLTWASFFKSYFTVHCSQAAGLVVGLVHSHYDTLHSTLTEYDESHIDVTLGVLTAAITLVNNPRRKSP
eukprot:EG_transcript_36713